MNVDDSYMLGICLIAINEAIMTINAGPAIRSLRRRAALT